MQCTDPNAPVTGLLGFVYSPVSATDPFFQLPLAFQPTDGSQYESPVGSGNMVQFPNTNFIEPKNAHAIQASAGNQVYSAYSDLEVPLSGISTMDPKKKTLNPFGMKPFGWNWQPNTQVLKGEVCTPGAPSTGNGHTYQAQNGGLTGAVSPIFPLTEGTTVVDGQVTWKEHTMVIANRLPPPAAPGVALSGAGSIPASIDVYAVVTLLNGIGETLPSLPAIIETLAGSSSVNVTTPSLASLQKWIQNLPAPYGPTTAQVYVAGVNHAQPAPPLSQYQAIGSPVALGTVVNVTAIPIGIVIDTISGDGTTVTLNTVSSLNAVNGHKVKLVGTLTHDGQFTMNSVNNSTFTYTWLSPNPNPDGGGLAFYPVLAVGGPPPSSCTARITPGQLPTPTTLPVIDRDPAGGNFPAGRDVYVLMTYTNAAGETPAGPASSVINTTLDDGVQVSVAIPLGENNVKLFEISSVGIYEADVATGDPAPPSSEFALVGYYQPGDTPIITATSTGPQPPITNTTGPGGNIQADTATGGANGTQGYRFAACGWINQIETFSGFTLASVVSTIIDEDGWEIGAFNIPTGPANVVGRYIPFSIADSSQAGPFWWIGLVNLQVPSQNVVYPTQTLIDQVEQSATVILDNTTTQATFNFTDTYLKSSNNVDDRLTITVPPRGVRVDFLESVQRLAVTGVPGYASGTWISLGGDFESFYGDNSPVPISSAGDVCYGVTDKYKGIPIALMKSGGFTLAANTGNPNSWAANRRWGGTDPGQQLGPCGFRAWCACGKFIIFAHRSGLYKYDESDPDMMSKEIPKLWATINWAAGETISVTIDEDTHTVIVLVPTGASAVPNQKFVLSYIEGWQNPIHFSTYSGKEISMDAARRWSPHDGAAFLCLRMERQLPAGGNAFIDGPTLNTLPDSSFQKTQLLFASSAPDGTVQARTPGIFNDNGGGIDAQYETMSSGMMQSVCKPEGFNLNACGYGTLFASFLASRAMETDQGGVTLLVQELFELECQPIPLTVTQISGITRKVEPAVNEFWRVRFTNGKVPDAWFSLKAMTAYVIPVTGGRDSGDQ